MLKCQIPLHSTDFPLVRVTQTLPWALRPAPVSQFLSGNISRKWRQTSMHIHTASGTENIYQGARSQLAKCLKCHLFCSCSKNAFLLFHFENKHFLFTKACNDIRIHTHLPHLIGYEPRSGIPHSLFGHCVTEILL